MTEARQYVLVIEHFRMHERPQSHQIHRTVTAYDVKDCIALFELYYPKPGKRVDSQARAETCECGRKAEWWRKSQDREWWTLLNVVPYNKYDAEETDGTPDGQ